MNISFLHHHRFQNRHNLSFALKQYNQLGDITRQLEKSRCTSCASWAYFTNRKSKSWPLFLICKMKNVTWCYMILSNLLSENNSVTRWLCKFFIYSPYYIGHADIILHSAFVFDVIIIIEISLYAWLIGLVNQCYCSYLQKQLYSRDMM